MLGKIPSGRRRRRGEGGFTYLKLTGARRKESKL